VKTPAAVAILWLCLPLGAAELVASWDFEDDGLDTVRDSGPHGLHGTARGVSHIPGVGEVDQALSFARAGARVEFPASAEYCFTSADSFAITCWLRVPRDSGSATVLSALSADGRSVSYRLALGRVPGRLTLDVWSWETIPLTSRHRVDDGEWRYVAAAYDAETNKAFLFVDDQVEAMEQVGNGGPETGQLTLGRPDDAAPVLSAELDDLEIYAGLPEDIAGIIDMHAHWDFLPPGTLRREHEAYVQRVEAAGWDASAPQGPVHTTDGRSVDGVDDPADVEALLQGLRDEFIALTHETWMPQEDAIHTIGPTLSVDGYRANRYVITSKNEVPLPVVLLFNEPEEGPEPGPAVILLDGAGKARAVPLRRRLITTLLDQGLVVCVVDGCGFGELRENWDRPGRAGLAAAGHDVKRVAEYLREREDVIADAVMAVGFDDAAPAVIAAGLYDEKLARIAAIGLRSGDAASSTGPMKQQPLMPGLMPPLAGALSPRCLWIQETDATDAYAWTAAAYDLTGVRGRFILTVSEPNEDDLATWLSAGW